ncbi:MAG: hypothetical protein LBP38_06955 [Desulfovibrio sp.]|jgi:hypothetical protein|nr:hypothetical protein [Desulfovibrio sp.]
MKENLPLPETWAGYAQHAYDALPLPTRCLRGEDVLRFRDEAFHQYFENPDYLAMILKTFGRGAVDEIARMVSYRLPRKYAPTVDA